MRIQPPPLISFKISINVFLIYFLLFIPIWKFIFSPANPWSNFYFEAFSFFTFVWLIYSKKITFSQEFSSKKVFFRNLFIGLGLGLFLFLSLLGLSYLFTIIGVGEKSFLVDKPIYPILDRYSNSVHFVKIFIFAVIEQTVFLCFFTQPLKNRFNLVLAIYLSAILLPVLKLKIVLGYFGLGLIGSTLFCFTGSMTPAILFQLFSSLSKLILLNYFSELIPILTFLL